MPESKKRKKPAAARPEARPGAVKPSPSWWAPTMVVLMVLGLVGVVLTYLTQGNLPVPGLGNWNLAIGFGVMLVGFFMTLRWR
ncbi:cell division protein CrgA [Georgenia thermotolerans]|uniref:Cell division protein CrgA n=1 Tax=Georgenia thermotolerans TaxID=527326 RepID=A0A7J5UJX2_9MICO|nr:cell division protein CrgA [Georgenia thermotolerans]KAE8762688.1 cell division protein CrgA [Georgenia thermotolerans]